MNHLDINKLILHEDEELLILNKPCGVLSQNNRGADASIHSLGEKYTGSQLHLTNRLDRPVSGIVVLTKRNGLRYIQDTQKAYVAVVPKSGNDSGVLEHYLKRDGRLKKAIIAEKNRAGFKKCKLEYETLLQLDHVDVVTIRLHTGRFHQIRAQLAFVNRPIRGDVKYGARRGNKDKSIDLHAFRIFIPKLDLAVTAPSNRNTPLWNRIDEELMLDKI